MKFDQPMLCSECARQGVKRDFNMSQWGYVDTLDVLRAVDSRIVGDCAKLQCLLRRCGSEKGFLRAHRALDDCVALRDVIVHVSAALDCSPSALLRPFIRSLDAAATHIGLSMLLDSKK